MGFDDDVCNTGLVLGLGFSSAVEISNQRPKKAAPRNFEPSLTLGIVAEEADDDDPEVLYRQGSGGTSSFSNASVKRERDVGSEEVERERVCSRISTTDEDDDGSNNNTRKKLRLNKDQSAVLEESFKQHSTLNPKQKQELARKLNMKPRQVEVWFQNRRARTKLKQTEVDCEFLKKCCETLNEENRRLKKELHELKVLKLSQPFYMAATLTMCPSCERIGSGGATADTTASKSPFSMAPNPHFFKPFTHPSAAC